MSAVAEAAPPVEEAPTYKEHPRELEIDAIVPSPFQMRVFDKARLERLEGLAASITVDGLIQPLIVRIVDGNRFELVAGERRWRAAKLAGLTKVPVVVKPLTRAAAARIVVVENDQREDVTVFERARGYAQLMDVDPRYRDRKVLAGELGKSLSWVHKAMKLLELLPAAQKALLDGVIADGHALLLVCLQAADQKQALDACLLRGSGVPGGATMSVRALKEWIANHIHMDLAKAPFKTDDAALLPAAGACTTCPKRAGVNPDLFTDARHPNTCTDRGCYDQKVQLSTKVRLDQLQSETGRPVIRVTDVYYLHPEQKKLLGGGDILTSDRYRDAGKTECPATKPAVLLVAESGAVKKEFAVCTRPHDCKVHNPRSTSSRVKSASDLRYESEQKRKERARRVEGDVRRRILEAVRDKVTELKDDDLRLVATRLFNEMHADRRKLVYGWMGWESPAPTKHRYGGTTVDFQKAGDALLVKASAKELAQFLVVAALSNVVSVSANPYYGVHDPKVLFETAKRWKVDASAIERTVRSGAAAVDRSKAVKAADAKKKAKSVETSPRKAKKKR